MTPFYSETLAVLTAIFFPTAAVAAFVLRWWSPTPLQGLLSTLGWLAWQRFAGSGFHLRRTWPDAPGKVVLVTGANTGIGFCAAVELLKARVATVVITCRDAEKGRKAVAAIRAAAGPGAKGDVRALVLNLDSFASVQQAAADFKRLGLPLHVLINNAGGTTVPVKRQWVKTVDGLEGTVGGNFVGPVLFTHLLTPLLEASAGRVVNVSSRGSEGMTSIAQINSIIETHPDFPQLKTNGANVFQLYCFTKAGNLFHAARIARTHADKGVTAVSLHPGAVLTDVWRALPIFDESRLTGRLFRAFLRGIGMKSSREGAYTTVHCALAPTVVNGGFYADESVTSKTAVTADPIAEQLMMDFASRAIKNGTGIDVVV